MQKEDINNLIKCLQWNLPEHIHEEAISKLTNIKDEHIRMLVMPINKDYWDKAAEVIKRIGYPRIQWVLPDILEWIADPNWPGYDIIIEILRNIDVDILKPHIQKAMEKAITLNDEIWEERLYNLLEDTITEKVGESQNNKYGLQN